MRKDMGKIITEKPRGGSSAKNAKTGMSIKWQGPDGNYDIPQKQSSSRFRIHGYNAKEFTDVLGPLYRYLDKQVGRPWNKVYSELCAFLDKRKVTHAHVFTHIDGYVEKDVYKGVDGFWHSRPYGGLIGGGGRRYGSLYVNPKTGLICRQIVKEADRPKKDYDTYKIDIYNEYRRIDGIWYHVKSAMILVDKYDFKLNRGYQKLELREVSRKQLNTKELRQTGLENLKCTCWDNPKRAKYIDPKCPIHKEKDDNAYRR
jgi:hypothetical protein